MIQRRPARPDLPHRRGKVQGQSSKGVAERHENAASRCLIGTASVAKSEILSGLLKHAGVKHEVLNAKQHERGPRSSPWPAPRPRSRWRPAWLAAAPTSSLGGNAEIPGRQEAARLRDRRTASNPRSTRRATRSSCESPRGNPGAGHDEVVELGGATYVVGLRTARVHAGSTTSCRGRSGRQGDPERAGSICLSATT